MVLSTPKKNNTKIVQFYRNFREFTGGHLKHWHYFNHTYYAASYLPYIYFGPDTVWPMRNPWRHLQQRSSASFSDNPFAGSPLSAPSEPLQKPDVLFVEGVSDWPVVRATYPNWQQIPTINLIQHVRHADPEDPRYEFLSHRAVRLCVSREVEAALRETQKVNGPLITIPCGTDVDALPIPLKQKPTEICIAALKNPELGQRLHQRLLQAGHDVVLLSGRMARSQFLSAVNQARLCVFLPWQTEGFYLPALEGMALNTLVICPDCVGNREFCEDGDNCLNPAYQEDEILAAIGQALKMPTVERVRMQAKGQATVNRYSLRQERRAFLALLENLEQLW